MKKRSIIAAAVMIFIFLSVMALPSFAFISYNAGAPIFWKSGVQHVYFSDSYTFITGVDSPYEIPETAFSASDSLFDTSFLSSYHNKYVDEGAFHFSYEDLNFYQTTSFSLTTVLSLSTFIAFNRVLYIDPGETVQFYVVPLSNRWQYDPNDGSNVRWYHFNLLSSVSFGTYDPLSSIAQFSPDTSLTYNVSVVAQISYNNNLPRNVYQVLVKNETSVSHTVTGLCFAFTPSNQNTNQPASPSFTQGGDLRGLGLRTLFSNVIKWYESTETDVVLNELAQIRAQNNRLIEIDEGIASGISDVNSGVQDLVDIWSETADYSDVEPDHSYSPDIPESEAIAEWGGYLDEADDILYSSDLRDSASFWQRTLTYLLNLPGVLTIAALTTFLLGARALLGR